MKNSYVFVIDENGNRITSIADNYATEKALKQRAKEQFPNASAYLYVNDGDEMLQAFIAGKVYKDGNLVDPDPIVLTDAEIKRQKVAEIKATYEEKFQKYETSLIRARLANNESAIIQIQELYKADLEKMALEIKGE